MLVSKVMDMRQQIVEAAREYIDVPWQHQGRNFHGIDCVGLLIQAGIKLGYKPLDIIDYSEFYDPSVLIKAFFKNGCRKIIKTKAVSGDIMIINVGRSPMHVGILSWKNNVRHIIHAYRPAGKVREEEVYPMLEKRFRFGFAYPGL